jgi:pimeloyl-ACP methyl ester carboxylesterase
VIATAQVNGITVGYDDAGSGLPVLFLHGFPHDRALWAQQRTALAPRVRCIAPDLRGFGATSLQGPYSMDQYADDAAALLDALDFESAVVCGLSMGGYIALALWRRYPERVRALVLCDTKAPADSTEARAGRDGMIQLAQSDGAGAVADKLLAGMISNRTRERQPGLEADVRQMMARQPVEGIVGALAAMRDRPDALATVRSITVPTLILVGDDDLLTPPREARAMLAALPAEAEGTLVVVEGSGHLSSLERPAAVTHALADFLANVSARAI